MTSSLQSQTFGKTSRNIQKQLGSNRGHPQQHDSSIVNPRPWNLGCQHCDAALGKNCQLWPRRRSHLHHSIHCVIKGTIFSSDPHQDVSDNSRLFSKVLLFGYAANQLGLAKLSEHVKCRGVCLPYNTDFLIDGSQARLLAWFCV